MVVVGGRERGGPSLHLTSALPNQIHAQMHVRTASYSTESLWKYRAFVSLLNKPLYSKLCKLLGVPQGHKDRDISPTVTGPPSGDTNWIWVNDWWGQRFVWICLLDLNFYLLNYLNFLFPPQNKKKIFVFFPLFYWFGICLVNQYFCLSWLALISVQKCIS